MNIKKIFAANVKYHRKRLKKSQESLAEGADMCVSYLSEIENAKRNITLEKVQAISKALSIPIHMLFVETVYIDNEE